MSKYTSIICIVNFVLAFAFCLCLDYAPMFKTFRAWLCRQEAYVALPLIVSLYLPAIICVASDMRDWAQARRR